MIRFVRKLLSKLIRSTPADQDLGAQRRRPVAELDAHRQRAAETILQNERLTAGLDDPVAQALLDWGLAMAEQAAGSIAGLDDRGAEEVMETRLQAIGRLMRRVRAWLANRAELDPGAGEELLAQVIEQAAIAYADYQPPGAEQRAQFVSGWHRDAGRPLQMLARLRALIEPPGVATPRPAGDTAAMEEKRDQEIC